MAVTGLGPGNFWLRVIRIQRLRELGAEFAARLSFEQLHGLLFQMMQLGPDHECPCN